jgi:hypothetical protein
VPNAYLRRISGPRVLKLELDPVEVEVLVVAPDDEGTPILEQLPEETREAEAKRLKLLKWLVPKKGVERDRLENVKAAASRGTPLASAKADRMPPPLPPSASVLPLGAGWTSLQQFLRGQAKKHDAVLADAIGGGKESGADMGNGMPRLLRADAVAAIADALEKIDRPEEPGHAGSLLRILAFYRSAADAGDGMLFFIA